MAVAFILFPDELERLDNVQLQLVPPDDSILGFDTPDAVSFSAVEEMRDEFLFYDILFSGRGVVTGFELRILDDGVRTRFYTDTQRHPSVQWNAFPTIWLTRARDGQPRETTKELFGELILCQSSTGTWALLVDLDDLLSAALASR